MENKTYSPPTYSDYIRNNPKDLFWIIFAAFLAYIISYNPEPNEFYIMARNALMAIIPIGGFFLLAFQYFGKHKKKWEVDRSAEMQSKNEII